MGDAGEGGEVGFPGSGAGADEAEGFGAGEGGGELDAGELVHLGEVGGGDDHGGEVDRDFWDGKRGVGVGA